VSERPDGIGDNGGKAIEATVIAFDGSPAEHLGADRRARDMLVMRRMLTRAT